MAEERYVVVRNGEVAGGPYVWDKEKNPDWVPKLDRKVVEGTLMLESEYLASLEGK